MEKGKSIRISNCCLIYIGNKQHQFEKAIDSALLLVEWYFQKKNLDVGPALTLLIIHFSKVIKKLKDTAAVDPSDNFSEIILRDYSILLDSARPDNEIVVLQTIGYLAACRGLSTLEKKIHLKVIRSDTTESSAEIKRELSWYRIFFLLNYDEINETDIDSLISEILKFQPGQNLESVDYFILTIFAPFEMKAENNPDMWAPVLLRITEIITIKMSALDAAIFTIWEPYLLYAKGKSYFLSDEKEKAYEILRNVSQTVVAAKNWRLGERVVSG